MTFMQEKKRGALAPPMCKICDTPHWFNQPHVFGKAKALAVAKERLAEKPKRPKPKQRKPLQRRKALR